MNIGIVTTWFERGASYVSKQFLTALSSSENYVFIYARGGEEYAETNENWNQYTVHWGKKTQIPLNTAINETDFKKWIISNKIDTLLFNEQSWWPPVIWAKEMGVKIGAYIDYYKENTIQLFAVYDFIICNTQRHFSVFKWHPFSYYVPWGTDLACYKPSNTKFPNLTFFHSSGMNPHRKGTDFVIRAFHELNNDSTNLIIHTQVPLVDFFPNLSSMIANLIDSKKLIVIEKSVTAPGLYSMGDVYVYPSRLDGLGLTICEAYASGLPCILTNNPPMNEFYNESSSRLVEIEKLYSRSDGYYWPQCDVNLHSLINQMNYYILNRDKMDMFKSQARLFAENNFNWSVNASNLIKLIQSTPNQKITPVYKNLILNYERKERPITLTLSYKYPTLTKLFIYLTRLLRISLNK